MSTIIVNADDFGADDEINAGVMYCFEHHIIQRTTLMVNMERTEEAVMLAKEHALMDRVGLHVNLTVGRPLTEAAQASALCDVDGQMTGAFLTLKNRLRMDPALSEIVEGEIEAQIRKYLSYGFPLRHMDSHQHVHVNYSVLPIFLRLAERYQFRSVRVAQTFPPEQNWIRRIYRMGLQRPLARYNRRRGADKAGGYQFGEFDAYTDQLTLDQTASVKLMIHPKLRDDELYDGQTGKNIEEWHRMTFGRPE